MPIPKTTVKCSCGDEFTRIGMQTHLRNNPSHKEIYRYSFRKEAGF